MVRGQTGCFHCFETERVESNSRTNETRARFRRPAARGSVLGEGPQVYFLINPDKFVSTILLRKSRESHFLLFSQHHEDAESGSLQQVLQAAAGVFGPTRNNHRKSDSEVEPVTD